MWEGIGIRLPSEWEERIEAFEVAHRQDGCADIAAFLPDDTDPFRTLVLAEMLRIDLEYSWKRGVRKRIEEYQPLFPKLFDNSEALRAVAYEEYRLRRQAGEEPTPAEYEERIGMPIGFWPRPNSTGPVPRRRE
jgi:hypothetical protein